MCFTFHAQWEQTTLFSMCVLRFVLHQNQHICLSLKLNGLPDANFSSLTSKGKFIFGHTSQLACGTLGPWPGIKATLPALEVWSLNHWTTKSPKGNFLKCYSWPNSKRPVPLPGRGWSRHHFCWVQSRLTAKIANLLASRPLRDLSPPGTSSPVSLLLSPPTSI